MRAIMPVVRASVDRSRLEAPAEGVRPMTRLEWGVWLWGALTLSLTIAIPAFVFSGEHPLNRWHWMAASGFSAAHPTCTEIMARPILA
jgi:hypothetical protein